jgi:hypothetical protein
VLPSGLVPTAVVGLTHRTVRRKRAGAVTGRGE